jgi:thiamine-phosphate pyrophosphorylase
MILSACRSAETTDMTFDHSIYAIVDPQIARGRSLADLARIAADNGATVIQYRAKETSTRIMIDDSRSILAALAGTNVPLLINDRIDVALAVGAQGVHIGRDDMGGHDARRLLGPSAIIGVTIKGEIDFPAIDAARATYACVGGVYTTTHKKNADAPLGVEGYGVVRARLKALHPSLPVGAIAGITADNAAPLIVAGADGVAVMGALFDGADVAARTRHLAQCIADARRQS